MLNIKTGNEITAKGKFWGGLLVVLFTLLPLLTIIAIWPDKLAPVGNGSNLNYQWNWFNVRLADNPSFKGPFINLNAIIFILVTASGFLGSMIHVATSFANYVGSEQFKKSWITWYFVKPFTATGLALILYFVLRAGVLNFGDSNNVNLYGLVTLAALAGLFADKATLKLEEVFSVIFKSKDDRPDKLSEEKINVKVTGISPEGISVDPQNMMMISGEGTDGQMLKLKLNHIEIPDFTIKPDGISFSYSIPDDMKAAQSMPLQIFDETGRELFKKNIQFKQQEQ